MSSSDDVLEKWWEENYNRLALMNWLGGGHLKEIVWIVWNACKAAYGVGENHDERL